MTLTSYDQRLIALCGSLGCRCAAGLLLLLCELDFMQSRVVRPYSQVVQADDSGHCQGNIAFQGCFVGKITIIHLMPRARGNSRFRRFA